MTHSLGTPFHCFGRTRLHRSRDARTLLFVSALAAFVLQLVYTQPLQAESKARPNLVLILADDLGYGDVGFHGSKEIQTPNLDKLAADGMTFSAMRANCTVCSPTRAAILTGWYADRAGVPGVIRTNPEGSFGFLKPGLETIADRLGSVGYHTAIVGKWHLGLESPSLPNERGFDHFHGFLGDMMDDYYTHRRQGFNYMQLNGREIDPEGHATDLFTQWAIDYVEQRAAKPDQPFFLYLPYNAPHFPIQPPDAWLKKIRERSPELAEPRARNVALIEHLDDSLGKLFRRLDELGLRDNTAVAFTSDNGGSLPHSQNNDPWRDGKQSHYDGGLRVPFVVRYPDRVAAGSRSDYQGLTFDLHATFLDYADATIPDDSDAVSLVEMLESRSEIPGERELYFVRREGNMRYVGQAYHAIIRGKWKLMQNDPFSPLELYDLENDPQEKVDLVKKNQKIVSQLKKSLSAHIQRGGRTAWQRDD